MTLFLPVQGRRILYTAIVEDGTPVTLFTADPQILVTVESISLTLKGADVSFEFRGDFVISSVSHEVSIAFESGVGTAKTWMWNDHHVPFLPGQSLIFEAGGATEMHIVAVCIESSSGGASNR